MTKHSHPATLEDVASLAEVSPKTVSRVANAEPGVKPSTRDRVLRAIELLDYKPNLSARILAGDRSYLIGLFCDKPGDYLSDFQAGAVNRCRESGYHLMVEPWDRDSPGFTRQVTTLLRQLRLDGVILLPPLSDDRLICTTLRDAAIPMVQIAPRAPAPDSPSIGINDYQAARELTAHLISLGHKHIGFILGRPGHGATEERYRGFVDEMHAHQLQVDSSMIETGNFVFSDGVTCAERMLRAASPPTAIFASNDDMAAAVISVAHRIGLELPRDLSVVGFDDAPVATMIWPLLTTVRQPVALMARHAAALIIEHSPRRQGWPDPMPHGVLEFELMVRDSTAPPRADSALRKAGVRSRRR
ncbi:MAG TPA: LacI family DNA-binding transcriptional regulator [Steroidobacteraceae bacterium]|nr:LacI family DNA-binding transcriptional regulator [Steroidobacteraceae bacterium]